MSQFIGQYFDINFMGDHFSTVFTAFWLTLQLSLISGVLSLIWGLILSLLRQVPGSSGRRSAVSRSPTSTSSAASRCCW